MHPMDLTFGTWSLTGGGTAVDLIAATTNALNGALLARRPDHYRNYTFVGIILMAIIGGIAGGVTRDVILGNPPSAFMNPAYITFCVVAGVIGYFIAYASGQLFREGLFQFMTSFSLPWYAIIGAQKANEAGYPILGALAIAVIAPTAGRFLIDVTSGVTPKQFVRGEWFVATAIGTGLVWIVLDEMGVPYWISVAIAFLIGFTFRVLALYRGWEEPLAREPKGLKMHADKRPLLGRKLAGKSQEELRMLGLTVDDVH
ncbi:TRIC cation channel family protein [Microbacterium sp. M3]|uniref:TRIC cation channel family protein n=1 Tax=Microbacterium arthrosphaerae TaxID=792652 RepID=A0ABU4H5D6_9MICO|nr:MULTISPECIES: TRIC cation channel family protein [Microbacterium]MDW4573937.1 TRIC cation channel family protein [Microbacterium arthrosphaerae]MDW7607792.1 TRIC cation channel family protein [Microbacterium sp. M3]